MASSSEMWRAAELGERKELRLQTGTIPYWEAGSGPALVFVHGALVNANHWRKVVGRLSGRFRCMTLDLPLGAHSPAMDSEADLTPPALAALIANSIEAIGLEDVTLVGNDTGGALCQLVVTRHPERVDRLVLTSCDAFDNFPPKVMRPAMPVLTLRGSLPFVFAPMRLTAVRRRLMTMIRATKRPVPLEVVDSYAYPALRSGGVRRDLAKLLRGADSRYTLEAAEHLREFEGPALIAWSREDKFFPTEHAQRLAGLLPKVSLEWIDDSYTFSPEDQPARLAELIADFVRGPDADEMDKDPSPLATRHRGAA